MDQPNRPTLVTVQFQLGKLILDQFKSPNLVTYFFPTIFDQKYFSQRKYSSDLMCLEIYKKAFL